MIRLSRTAFVAVFAACALAACHRPQVDSDHFVGVFDGAADGMLSEMKTFDAGGSTRAVAVGDLDGDGISDVVVGTASVVRIFNGGTAGALPLRLEMTLPASALAIGDVNHDGRVDLVTADNGTVSVHLQREDGGFTSTDVTVDVIVDRIALIDAGGEVSPGVVALGRSGEVVLIPVPGGVPGAPESIATFEDPSAMVSADFDADGKVDLFVADRTGGFLLTPDGAGKLVRSAQLVTGAFTMVPGATQPHCDASDFDRDGKVDLVCVTLHGKRSGLDLLRNDGAGHFSVADLGLTGPVSVVAGDVDGDGKADVVASLGGSFAVAVLHGDGAGHFRRGTDLDAADEPRALAIADVSGDGRPDVTVVADKACLSGTSGCP